MSSLKILWIEDDPTFPGSVTYRMKGSLRSLDITFQEEILNNGLHVWETVRDWKPDIIMMDHNLEDVSVNGANLIVQIRFHDNDTPIIFYSSEMGANLIEMIDDHNEIYTSPRGDVSDELLRLIQSKFAAKD